MAEIIPVGAPANEYERRVAAVLTDAVPEGWTAFTNVEMNLGRRGYELDAVVMAPHAFYLLDVRAYGGEIGGDTSQWWLPGGQYIDSPIDAMRRRQRIFTALLDRVRHQHGVDARLPVEGFIVLAGQRAVARMNDPRAAAHVVTLDELPLALKDTSRLAADARGRTLGESVGFVRDWLARRLSPELLRDKIGLYKVIAPLEETDDYRAFLAKHRFVVSDPEVKLKVYPANPSASGPERAEFLDGLFRDLRALRALGDHPSLLGTTEVFEWGEDQYVLVSRWKQGRYLHTMLREESFAQRQRLGVVADVADALAHAHARGVVHRNVRPENVLVDAMGRGALINFGMARVRLPGVATVSTMMAAVRPSPYAAPEVAQGGVHAASPRSDQYALGALTFQLLTGRLPAFRDGVLDPTISGVAPEFTRDAAWHVMATLCAPDPEARYGSTEHAAEALRMLAT